jgi:HK97 family phage prohead protease
VNGNIEQRARYDDLDFTPPEGVRKEAEKGLAWRREFGRGGTEIGIARARDLSNGVKVSPDTVRRMKAYFDRHEVDKKGEGFNPGEPGFPSNGRIAWALWGSDAGWSWARKLVSQMESRDKPERNSDVNIERRSLLNAEVSFPAIRVETRSEEVPDPNGGEPKMTRRDWCVGYASVFGLLSLDLGDFVERIDPRAFDRILEKRDSRLSVEPRALWNHDSNYPLARYPETLRLQADERGLRYEFPFPRSSYGQDLRTNIEDGIVKGSSFGFVVAPGGESWGMEDGRSVRTVKEISALYDVSPTTYPAYPDSDVSVAQRSFDRFRAAVKKPVSQVRRSKEIEKFLAERAAKHGGKIR